MFFLLADPSPEFVEVSVVDALEGRPQDAHRRGDAEDAHNAGEAGEGPAEMGGGNEVAVTDCAVGGVGEWVGG